MNSRYKRTVGWTTLPVAGPQRCFPYVTTGLLSQSIAGMLPITMGNYLVSCQASVNLFIFKRK